MGRRLPRFGLWLAVAEAGFHAETLRRSEVLAFCDGPLGRFLHEHEAFLPPRGRRRLRRRLAGFDPSAPTPYERMEALTG